MNNEQKQYILRKPVTILHELDYSLELNLGEYMMPVDKDCFKDEFVPLDIDDIRKQIADIMTFYRTLVNGWAETGAGADDLPETALKESVDRVFSLITGGMYE